MRKYDFAKAKEYIELDKGYISSASLGMHEDWYWTAETIFDDGEYLEDLNTLESVGGISGSSWATPTLEIVYKNEHTRMIPCYVGEPTQVKPYWLDYSLGVLSKPVQDNMQPLEEE